MFQQLPLGLRISRQSTLDSPVTDESILLYIIQQYEAGLSGRGEYRDSTDKSNQILLLSVMGSHQLPCCYKVATINLPISWLREFMAADTEEIIKMILNIGLTYFVLVSIKYVHTLLSPSPTPIYKQSRTAAADINAVCV